MANSLRILRPDDWHQHVRDGAQLASVLPFTARQFARAIIMPNLKPPVTTLALAAAYRERILAAVPADARFEPLVGVAPGPHPGLHGGQQRVHVRVRVGPFANGVEQLLCPLLAGKVLRQPGNRHGHSALEPAPSRRATLVDLRAQTIHGVTP